MIREGYIPDVSYTQPSPIPRFIPERLAGLSDLAEQMLCLLYRQHGPLVVDDICTLVYEYTHAYDFTAQGETDKQRQQYLNMRDAGLRPLRREVTIAAGVLMGRGLIYAYDAGLYGIRSDVSVLETYLPQFTLNNWSNFACGLEQLSLDELVVLIGVAIAGKVDFVDPSNKVQESVLNLQSQLELEPHYLSRDEIQAAIFQLQLRQFLRLGYTGDSNYLASTELKLYLRQYADDLLIQKLLIES